MEKSDVISKFYSSACIFLLFLFVTGPIIAMELKNESIGDNRAQTATISSPPADSNAPAIPGLARNAESIMAVTSILALISLGLIYLQIRDTRNQIRDTRIWNKLHFTYTFFPDPFKLEQLEIFLDETLEFWKRDQPLTEIEVKAIMGREQLSDSDINELKKYFTGVSDLNVQVPKKMEEAGRKLKLYLNQIEAYCAAIRSGIIDSETAKLVYSFKFQRAHQKAKPWIDKTRTLRTNNTLYIELEEVLAEWFPKEKPETQKKKFE